MRFEKIIPADALKPFVKYFAISENELEQTYKVLPSAGLVAGLQYRGQLSSIVNNSTALLSTAGITGVSDTYKIFRQTGAIGTMLIYFTEIGFAAFTSTPAHELFNQSISLDHIFDHNRLRETEEKLAMAETSRQRVAIVQRLLLTQLKAYSCDELVNEAVRLIQQSRGSIRIKDLSAQLHTSQSPLEKRFRKIVGASPKKFASIVRFKAVVSEIKQANSLTAIAYDNGFFDQSHFIRDFRRFTGNAPEDFLFLSK